MWLYQQTTLSSAITRSWRLILERQRALILAPGGLSRLSILILRPSEREAMRMGQGKSRCKQNPRKP